MMKWIKRVGIALALWGAYSAGFNAALKLYGFGGDEE